MCSEPIRDAAFASRSKRTTPSASIATLAFITLIATRLPRRTFTPSYTSPMPPSPMSRRTRYFRSRMSPDASKAAAQNVSERAPESESGAGEREHLAELVVRHGNDGDPRLLHEQHLR